MPWLAKHEDPPNLAAPPGEKRTPRQRRNSKQAQSQATLVPDGILPAFDRLHTENRMVPDFVRVSPSPLHGFGVFAVMPLARCTVVGHYQGTMSRECPNDRTFVIRVDIDSDDHFYIDARDPHISNFTRYLNDPGPLGDGNCEFVQDDLSIQVVTRRAIAPHEELTVRYLDWHTSLGATSSDADEDVTPVAVRPKQEEESSRHYYGSQNLFRRGRPEADQRRWGRPPSFWNARTMCLFPEAW